jgi:hypothetical protein
MDKMKNIVLRANELAVKKYKIVYKTEFTYTAEEFKKLKSIDDEVQELIDQDSSEHSDKSNWVVEIMA